MGEESNASVGRGKDPEDARHGVTSDRPSSTSGSTPAYFVRASNEHDDDLADIDELSSNLSFIVVDKAPIGSDILRRVQNLQPEGGIRTAELYNA